MAHTPGDEIVLAALLSLGSGSTSAERAFEGWWSVHMLVERTWEMLRPLMTEEEGFVLGGRFHGRSNMEDIVRKYLEHLVKLGAVEREVRSSDQQIYRYPRWTTRKGPVAFYRVKR